MASLSMFFGQVGSRVRDWGCLSGGGEITLQRCAAGSTASRKSSGGQRREISCSLWLPYAPCLALHWLRGCGDGPHLGVLLLSLGFRFCGCLACLWLSATSITPAANNRHKQSILFRSALLGFIYAGSFFRGDC